jgi:ArsR family transcriptional regulator, zinc-responsive transcriptional repressor
MIKKKVRRNHKKKLPVDYNKLPWLTPLKALGEAAECLKTLAHPHRLRMVQMMLHGRYTVGELATACGIPQAMASDHLRLMQRCSFLASEKVGRQVFYRIAEPHLASLMACVEGRFHPQSAQAKSEEHAAGHSEPMGNQAEQASTTE